MRTTVSIDDDVLRAVQERARRERRSVGDVLSQLARSALTAPQREAPSVGRHGFRPLATRGQTISNDLVNELRDDEP